LEHSNSEI